MRPGFLLRQYGGGENRVGADIHKMDDGEAADWNRYEEYSGQSSF